MMIASKKLFVRGFLRNSLKIDMDMSWIVKPVSCFSVCDATNNHVNAPTLNQNPQSSTKLPELKCQTFNGKATFIL